MFIQSMDITMIYFYGTNFDLNGTIIVTGGVYI